MITLFTCPKPFIGHIGTIQRNAIQSWKLLDPSIQIILFGDEEGTASIAQEIGAVHNPDIQRNKWGTPLLDDIFKKAEQNAKYNVLCYINSDIILLREFKNAIRCISKNNYPFLLVGQRCDLEIVNPLIFEENWEEDLKKEAGVYGVIISKNAIDFFAYPRGSLPEIPPFAIGRPAWDNWLLYQARAMKFRVIDGTDYILTIHQKHDYSHVKNRTGENWEGPEADQNRLLAGGYNYMYNLDDANYRLTKDLQIKRDLRKITSSYLKTKKKWAIHTIKKIKTWVRSEKTN